MATRKNISSGSPFEPTFGYSRAVRVGNMVFVSGSTAIQPDGTVTGVGDPYAQAAQALETIEKALVQAGGSMKDVVRTRIFSTDLMGHLEALSKAHSEVFGEIRPASTGVEIARLAHPDLLIEIEADAVIEE